MLHFFGVVAQGSQQVLDEAGSHSFLVDQQLFELIQSQVDALAHLLASPPVDVAPNTVIFSLKALKYLGLSALFVVVGLLEPLNL